MAPHRRGKPRLRRYFGFLWVCDGLGVVTQATSFQEAYGRWLAKFFNSIANNENENKHDGSNR